MKRLMTTILVMVVLIGIGADVANAQINWSCIARTERIRNSSGRFPLIGGGRISRMGGRIGGSRLNLQCIARTEMIRHTSGGRFPRIGGYGRYGGYGSSGTNVRIRYNERWGIQGGQRSYERSPDYLGKVIDSATTLGTIAILSH